MEALYFTVYFVLKARPLVFLDKSEVVPRLSYPCQTKRLRVKMPSVALHM
jgi:hypothetical protein